MGKVRSYILMNFYIAPEMLSAIEKVAIERSTTKSALIREIIATYLKQE